jgi:hypothetical protein
MKTYGRGGCIDPHFLDLGTSWSRVWRNSFSSTRWPQQDFSENFVYLFIYLFILRVNLPVVLYGCEIFSLTLTGEHRNRALHRIFGRKRNEVTGRNKFHNEQLRNLFCTPNIIRMIKSRTMRWARLEARMGKKMNACRILVGKPERKRPFGRSRRRWVKR